MDNLSHNSEEFSLAKQRAAKKSTLISVVINIITKNNIIRQAS